MDRLRHRAGRIRREPGRFSNSSIPKIARVVARRLSALDDRNVYGCDFRIVRPDGTVRWVANQGRVFFDGNNEPHRLIGIIVDISDRKRRSCSCWTPTAARTSSWRRWRTNCAIRWRRSATRVQILLLSGLKRPDMHGRTEVIERQVRQMVRLVDDLLDVSRITRGKIELRKERVELAAVVRERGRDEPAADRRRWPPADVSSLPPSR